ncbi:lipase secretion chaperone [Marinobacter xestospongiae]|uniref:lipase secretion chaperone n=1 Tax=Marinobacter xestospongiae TaxID=994319 RepID=UPI002005F3E8|nr:lipase secretion chaperone [Marinobacter xestospongiae]MCK7565108.1 hypothetical protein [Marinobacter xestospongiae]
MPTRTQLLALTVTSLGLMLGLWLQQTAQPGNVPLSSSPLTERPAHPISQGAGVSGEILVSSSPQSSQPKPLPPLPPHLADAQPRFRLAVDSDGNLRPTPDMRRLFDFYLAGLTDEPLELVMTRIQQALSDELGDQPQALAQARNLLTRYIDYRLALDDLAGATPPRLATGAFDLEALRQRQQHLQTLRGTQFNDDEQGAFFALESRQDEHLLTYMEIAQHPGLQEDQRAQALAALEHSLPTELRQLRQRVTSHAELYQHTRQLRDQGASPAELYQLRAQTLGDNAAARLAELDRERQYWRQRLDTFVADRNRLRQSELPPAAQQAAIDQLIEQRFSATEALRVRALSPEL